MTNFLLRLAARWSKDSKTEKQNIGYMASIVGIVINLMLSIVKLVIGFTMSSIGVIADGFNNITDTASSIIALIAFKISHKPPDREHPYGHGRVEYISGLIISFIVIFVGFQFITTSIKEILNPKPVRFQMSFFIILLLSIFVKLWLSIFNKKLSEETNSTSIRAMSLDALGDVLTTGVVVISLFIGRFTSMPIDGYIGIIVSALIIYNGFNIVRETTSTLIGKAPDREMIDGIKSDILGYRFITGVHDLHIHSYGENKTMAVIDAEFPAELDIVEVHKEVTIIEKEIGEKYDLNLVVHMDPLDKESQYRYELRQEIKKILRSYPIYESMHDFKIFKGEEVNTIEFDMVVFGEKLKDSDSKETLEKEFEEVLKSKYPNKNFNITVDIDFG